MARISLRLSGGADNADPNQCLGGVISSYDVYRNGEQHNLFDMVTAFEANNTDLEYRCMYIFNNGPNSWQNGSVWIARQVALAGVDINLGLDPNGVGDGVTTGVALITLTENTDPLDLADWEEPLAKNDFPIPTLNAGQGHAFWMRRFYNRGDGLQIPDQEWWLEYDGDEV